MAQDGSPRRGSLVFPILLIAVGGLFLYSNWRPAFDPLPVLFTYWPLILIFIGLGKIWDTTRRGKDPNAPGGHSLGATIGVLASVFVLFAFLWHGHGFMRRHGSRYSMQHVSKTVERQGAKFVKASVEMGAGDLSLSGGSNNLLEASFDYRGSSETPRVEYRVDGGTGDLTVSQGDSNDHFNTISDNDWNLHLSKDVPMDLKVDMGAGRGTLRLRDLNLTRLELNMGAGRVDVDLTGDRKQDLQGSIEGGVGAASIRLPKNVGVVVNASGGIGSIDSHGLKHDGDEYTNDAYGKSPATIHLKVEGGVGRISLTQEP